MNQKYLSEKFVMRCFAKKKNDRPNDYIFSGSAKKSPIDFELPSLNIHFSSSVRIKNICDSDQKCQFYLIGELYGFPGDDEMVFLLNEFHAKGTDFIIGINGSFIIIMIDDENDRVILFTDRLNTRKVFFSVIEGDYWFSNSIQLLPVSNHEIDSVGLAYYLSHGVIFNNRTLIKEVTVLERASKHILSRQKLQSEQYWTYIFSSEYANTPEEELKKEFSRLLEKSVSDRLMKNHKTFLSLSGGYDSSSILGILASKLKPSEIECFTYEFGTPLAGSDAEVSMKRARLLGISHELINSFDGDILETLKRQAMLGQGLCNFCDEMDGWIRLSDKFDREPSILFVGDKSFFSPPSPPFDSVQDVLQSGPVSIHNLNILSFYQRIFCKGVYRRLEEEIREDMNVIMKRPPSGMNNFQDLKDFFFLDQRTQHKLLPWREFLIGNVIPVKNPYIDNSITDFWSKLPRNMRKNEYIFKKTVVDMFPELFAFSRSSSSYNIPDWRRIIRCSEKELNREFLSGQSRLDEFILPDKISTLFNESKAFAFQDFLLRTIRYLQRKNKVFKTFFNGINPGYSYIQIDNITLLKRVLLIRSFFRTFEKKNSNQP